MIPAPAMSLKEYEAQLDRRIAARQLVDALKEVVACHASDAPPAEWDAAIVQCRRALAAVGLYP